MGFTGVFACGEKCREGHFYLPMNCPCTACVSLIVGIVPRICFFGSKRALTQALCTTLVQPKWLHAAYAH